MREFLIDQNAHQAAFRAGFSRKDTAAGYRLMRHPRVAEQIQAGMERIFARLDITADDVRQGFIGVAFDAKTEAQGGPTRVERMMALDRLAKMFGLYKVERPGDVGKSLEQLLNEATAIESQLGPAAPPPRLRLIDGGRT